MEDRTSLMIDVFQAGSKEEGKNGVEKMVRDTGFENAIGTECSRRKHRLCDRSVTSGLDLESFATGAVRHCFFMRIPAPLCRKAFAIRPCYFRCELRGFYPNGNRVNPIFSTHVRSFNVPRVRPKATSFTPIFIALVRVKSHP